MLLILFLILILIYFQNKGVPIFLYHQVNDKSNIDAKLFEEHLKILKEKKMNTITLTEYGNGNLPKNPFLITLDDGYYDNYKIVFPLLKKYNMKATIFLNTLYIAPSWDKEEEILINSQANFLAMEKYLKTNDATTRQYMSWEEIKEMYKSGLVDFQAHSHKHTAVFVSTKLEGIMDTKEDEDITNLYAYGAIKNGYPKFPKRGEYASQAININKEFFEIFKDFHDKNLLNLSKKEKLKKAQEFVDKNIDKFIKKETEEEFLNRVRKDYLLNKKLIEENINNKVEYFCWPWGHRNKKVIKSLKKLGVKGFVSTKKGTNARRPNFDMIRRIELRKFTKEKFKLNLFLARNYIIGKIYGWVS